MDPGTPVAARSTTGANRTRRLGVSGPPTSEALSFSHRCSPAQASILSQLATIADSNMRTARVKERSGVASVMASRARPVRSLAVLAHHVLGPEGWRVELRRG